MMWGDVTSLKHCPFLTLLVCPDLDIEFGKHYIKENEGCFQCFPKRNIVKGGEKQSNCVLHRIPSIQSPKLKSE